MVADLQGAYPQIMLITMFWGKKPSSKPSGDLEERVAALESSLRRLDSDMDDLWSRFKRWTGREAKRAAVDEQLHPQLPPGVPHGADPKSAAIIARRMALRLMKPTNGAN